ncbi:MAG: hypothetical protein K2M75_01480 [Clostridia bacterium]|nr:hypothetical protein [Clostridia bacterium]
MILIDKQSTYISPEAKIADDVIIYPNNHIIGNTVIGKGCKIMPNCILTDSVIGAGCTVTASVLEEAKVGDTTTVGPYAYLRKGASVGSHCRIGDFVEIKNSTVGDYTKASHLAYIGDATVGARCNIGCGVIFVNYDGKTKHKTTVEDDCFIGSNCNIIAPVTLREGSYIAAGTTVTEETPSDSFVIGRSRQIVKDRKDQKKKMKFGTDGMRGLAYEELSEKVAFEVGNALGRIKQNAKVVIGRDTRSSGVDLSASFIEGLLTAGGNVMDVGVMPTAGVAYLTKKHGCDYGIVISASHNPPQYNGIKVFDSKGYKASKELEKLIESNLGKDSCIREKGERIKYSNGEDEYADFLIAKGADLSGMKILLDCSNGASGKVAPMVFKALGADVTAVNTSGDGRYINDNCGAVNAHLLCDKAKDFDVTFSFDGDSDRLIALDEQGNIVDGDKNLYIIGKYLKAKDALKGNIVVGTTMTNMGISKAIEDMGVQFVREDVGDKYVLRRLLSDGGVLGGEGSGHTILLDESSTGDGVQTAVILAKIIKESQAKLSQLANVDIYPQVIESVEVKDKSIATCQSVIQCVKNVEKDLQGQGRVVLRPSGTENKIRVMVECQNMAKAENSVKILTKSLLKENDNR